MGTLPALCPTLSTTKPPESLCFPSNSTMGCGTSKTDTAALKTQQRRQPTTPLRKKLRRDRKATPKLRRERKATPNPHRFDAKGGTFHFPTYERSPTSSEMASSTHSSEELEMFSVTPPPVEARHPICKKVANGVAKHNRTRRISDRSALSQTLKIK